MVSQRGHRKNENFKKKKNRNAKENDERNQSQWAICCGRCCWIEAVVCSTAEAPYNYIYYMRHTFTLRLWTNINDLKSSSKTLLKWWNAWMEIFRNGSRSIGFYFPPASYSLGKWTHMVLPLAAYVQSKCSNGSENLKCFFLSSFWYFSEQSNDFFFTRSSSRCSFWNDEIKFIVTLYLCDACCVCFVVLHSIHLMIQIYTSLYKWNHC